MWGAPRDDHLQIMNAKFVVCADGIFSHTFMEKNNHLIVLQALTLGFAILDGR
jgi:hypothetical protein